MDAGLIEPITQSVYDTNLMNSSYTQGFSNLLTVDQKRYIRENELMDPEMA